MMSREEKLDAIFRMAEDIRRRREARRVKALGGVTAALSLSLAALIGLLADHGAAVRGTEMGAFLLGPEAGGYAIVALLSFALGIAVAMISMRKKLARRAGSRKTEL